MFRAPPEWGVEPVPAEKKILRSWDIIVLWSSLGVGLLVMQAGALLVQWLGLSLFEATLISIIGSIIGSLILALAGVIGSKYGVPTMVSFRPILGVRGTYLFSLLNVIQLIGWTIFEVIIMGEAATSISGEFLGSYTRIFWSTIFGLWCTLLAVYGPLAVVRQWLEKFAIWLVYISSIWITFNLAQNITFTVESTLNNSSILLGLDLVIAMPISWMPLISDYNRFARSVREGVLGTFISYTIANAWFYIMGVMLATIYPSESIVFSIAILMLGQVAILGILVDETDNAFADIYSAAVSIQNIFPKTRQWKLSAIIGILSLFLSYVIPIAQYENFLFLIGAIFIPLFGILFADYFVIRKGKYEISEFYDGKVIDFKAIFSWLTGFITYYLLTYIFTELSIGATIPTLLTSFIVYLLIKKVKA
ncbi:MAG: cytosine permease [archaeon GB-1867-035]|nr:cytosine permease [Candidatus Culexmicrobium profundum]